MSGYLGGLSEEQQEKLDELKDMLEQLEDVTTREYAKKSLDDAIILRFLRARKFDLGQSYDMLVGMLKFRQEFQTIGVDAIEPSMCENELKTGKSFYHNYDKEGRPVCYIRSRLHDPYTTDVQENQRYTVLMMEYGKRLLKSGETVTIVFDMSKAAIKNLDIKSVQFMVNTLQSYYPESLGKILVYNSTWIVNGAWKIIRPWLDPVTAAKVAFITQEDIKTYIPEENLPVEYGGKDTFAYNFSTYKPLVVKALKGSSVPQEQTAKG